MDKTYDLLYDFTMRRILLFWGDVVVLYLALFLTLIIRYGTGLAFSYNLSIHFIPFTIIFSFWILVFYIANLYEISLTKNNLVFYTNFIYAIVFNILISVVFFYFVAYFEIAPKTNLFIFLSLELVLATAWRYFFNSISAKINLSNNTLILGLSLQSQELYDYLLVNPQLGYNALGIIDVEHTTAPDILENIVRQKKVKNLVLAPTAYKVPSIINILYHLVSYGVNFYNLSHFYEVNTGKVPLGAIDQAWFISNLSEGRRKGFELAKRLFDIILAIGIGFVASPLYSLIILAIKLDSVGPIFYYQPRVGKAGKIFTLVKFRNMIKDAESQTGPVWASENDARTTRIGKFLRRSRVDELPQIWNIIRGDMSFVGPRPERPEFHDRLKKEIPFYEERYLIKPGLTGWAQIKYKLDFRGGMTMADTAEKVQHDLYYIKNRSLLLDLGIILKTINILFKKVFR